MAKSKIDFKALLLNHGEKVGAGVVALLAFTGLATANWATAPSEIQPGVLETLAEKTKTSWLANAWTDDKKIAFENTPDVVALAERMQSETEDQERYSTVVAWNEPIYRNRDRRSAVTVLVPRDPEANAIAFVLAEKPDAEDEETDALDQDKEMDKSPDVGEDVSNTFGVAAGGLGGPGSAGGFPGGPGGGAGLAGGGAGLAGGGAGLAGGGAGLAGGGAGLAGGGAGSAGGYPGSSGGYPGSAGGGAPGAAGDMAGMMGGGYGESGYGDGGYGGLGGMMTAERKVRYHSGVSVRLICPLLEQIRSVAKSLHLPESDSRVSQSIVFSDFQIERKKAVPGTDPWSGEWESISTDEIGEILKKSLAFDLEIVNPSVTRSELTMPLPRRVAGRWTEKDASHKQLLDVKLDAEEQVLIDRYQAKLLEEAEKRKKLIPDPTKKGGFSRYMLNGSDLSSALGSGSSLTDDLYGEMSENKDPAQKSKYDDKEELKKLINRSMSTGRLLLVRFMDFTCDRGNSYIYRVRLEMRNPNFNYPIDELEQPDLATQATLFSDWSEPTTPVYVPQSYRYYAQRADNPQSVKVGMYFENEKAGTPTMANLEVRVGSRIGGKSNVDVVDLSKSVREIQDVEFKSPDLLAAVVPSLKLNANDSPELRAYIDSMRGHKPLSDRITVVDSNGAIVTRYVGDSVSNGGQSRTEALDSKFAEDVLKLYEHLKKDANAAAGGIYGGAGAGAGGPGMAGSGSGMMGGPGGMGGYGGDMGKGSSLSGGGKSSGKNRSGRGGAKPDGGGGSP